MKKFNKINFLVRVGLLDARFDTYIPVQAFHSIHISYTAFFFLPQLYMVNIFCLQSIRFFCLKFKTFARRLARLDASRSKKMNNRRLARLIYSYNRVHLELIETNDLYKNFLGVNMICFFIYAITLMFLTMFIGWILRLVLIWLVLTMFLAIIFIPFTFANSLLIQINKTKRIFENIAFNPSTSWWNRQKIESISNLSDKAGLTSFDWFRISSHAGLTISLELKIYLLLLLQTYLLYYST